MSQKQPQITTKQVALSSLEYVLLGAVTKNISGANEMLKSIGLTVGRRLAERCTVEHPRLEDSSAIARFVASEVWPVLTGHAVENVIFSQGKQPCTLTDNKLRCLSFGTEQALPLLMFYAGVLQAVFISLGFPSACTVTPEFGSSSSIAKFVVNVPSDMNSVGSSATAVRSAPPPVKP